ncbi:ABC transporter permease [bacterium]|nr:ABC transporter permease [bacterium]
MIWHIAAFELKNRFNKVSTHIYFLLFVLISYMGIVRGSGPLRMVGEARSIHLFVNAPFILYHLAVIMSYAGTLIACAFFGKAASRDYQYQTQGLFFSYPITKMNYVGGRFIGAALATLYVFSGAMLGALLVQIIPLFGAADRLGIFSIWPYVYPIFVGIIPNIIFVGAIFFAMAISTRKTMPVYTGGVIILLMFLLASRLAGHPDTRFLANLIDPFSVLAAQSSYGFWALAQKNIQLLPLSGPLLLNRLIFTGIGLTILGILFKRFQFAEVQESGLNNPEKVSVKEKKIGPVALKIMMQSVQPRDDFKTRLMQMFSIFINEMKCIFSNKYFRAILIMGTGIAIFAGFRSIGLVRGTPTYPATSQVLDVFYDAYYFLLLVIVLFLSVELIWRERREGVSIYLDPLPVPEWVVFIGKLAALLGTLAVIQVIAMASGIFIQLTQGYTHLEPGLYIRELFGHRWLYFSLIGILALTVQVLVNHKFLGWIVTLLICDDFIVMMGLEHNLWTFGQVPSYIYSDLVGYSPFIKAIVSYNLYWVFVSILFIVLALLFLVRGYDTGLKARFIELRNRWSRSKLGVSITALTGMICMGVFIIHNTTVLNFYESTKAVEKRQVEYENEYKKFENSPQLSTVSVSMAVDIFPDDIKVNSAGHLVLQNKSVDPVTEIFVQTFCVAQVEDLRFSRRHSLIEESQRHGVYRYTLEETLMPGDTCSMWFDIRIAQKGFQDRDVNTNLVQNGTSLGSNHLLPYIGYDRWLELEDNGKRKKYDLPHRERLPAIDDKLGLQGNIIGHDAELVDYETVMSTSSDQIAITSGTLVKSWQENGRRYFHYKSQHSMMKYVPFISGRYAVKQRMWQGIPVEIYYHPQHDMNVDLMLDATIQSLTLFDQVYSPYPYGSMKLVEFPRYEIMAEAYPGVIPISEGYGFMAKFEGQELPFAHRVMAHEVGHQWWPFIVAGAGVAGEFFLSEVMAQYSALLVVQESYDQDVITSYMKRRIRSYLRGRATERDEERPISLVNFETKYVFYEKGMMAMYALQDYLGKAALNQAIHQFVEDYAFHQGDAPVSLDLIRYFREAAPDSLHTIIDELFEQIIIYDNKSVKASAKVISEDQYELCFEFIVQKVRCDERGKEEKLRPHDLIDFVVFDDDDEILYSQKYWIDAEENTLCFIVNGKPAIVGIDPFCRLIDRHTDDNMASVQISDIK